jgi:4-amino-4-deoxy-L-arabinose transferase-like glycosyltransferase
MGSVAEQAAEEIDRTRVTTRAADGVVGTAGSALVLVGVWIAATLLVDPRADVPLIDDWVYASSVERLLQGKGFSVASFSSTFPPAQIAWGSLFAAAGGFSHTALRLSTLALALLGTLAFHAQLRRLGCDAATSLVGALTLALYPVAFVLSFTFMTDVPMLAATLASLWALVRGLGLDALDGPGTRWVVLGLGFALLAFLVRPVAVAIPAALLVTAWLHRPLPRRGRIVLLAGVTLAAMGAATVVARAYWTPAAGGQGSVAFRLERLRYVFLVSPWVYAEALLSMSAHVGLAAAPALLATAAPPRRWPWKTAAVLVAASIAVSMMAPESVTALKPQATWSTQELGGGRPLLRGYLAYGGARQVLAILATLLGLCGAAALLVRGARACRPRGALRSPAATCVALVGVLSLGLCFALWFFYDRYYLPLVPVAIMLALVTSEAPLPRRAAPRMAMAVAALAFLFALDVSGTRDMLDYARSVDAALSRLVASGVAWRDVDGGYVENGWHLYAHPEHLAPGAQVDRDVPHVTGWTELPYAIANVPLHGYTVREVVQVPRRWAASDRIYVLARQPPESGSAGGD